ncbi:MAG TPA: PEP-CTERM sorting domain-containing protein [Candidatus Eisenbacteria bacterium]|nr:PEP-CTERM sorting domain-containing protein [Candidatus Eisenbacteria bacterium]
MRLAPKKIFLLMACFLVLSSISWADVINFNNLPGDGSAVPSGYAGFNWHNLYDMSMNGILDATANLPVGGGVPAGLSFAFNRSGSSSAFSSSTGTFSFETAWLQSMDNAAMTLQVEGILHGAVVDSKLIVLAAGPAQLQTFDWSGINEVRFMPIASGGALQFLLTNLVINAPVPEPSTLLLLGSSLGLLSVQASRRHRKR